MTMPMDETGYAIPALRPGTTQKVNIASTATSAAAVAATTQVVRIKATVDCHVKFAAGATTSDMMLSGGETEYFAVLGGTVISNIRASADGSLFITEMV